MVTDQVVVPPLSSASAKRIRTVGRYIRPCGLARVAVTVSRGSERQARAGRRSPKPRENNRAADPAATGSMTMMSTDPAPPPAQSHEFSEVAARRRVSRLADAAGGSPGGVAARPAGPGRSGGVGLDHDGHGRLRSRAAARGAHRREPAAREVRRGAGRRPDAGAVRGPGCHLGGAARGVSPLPRLRLPPDPGRRATHPGDRSPIRRCASRRPTPSTSPRWSPG